jgi:hypothetical protein
MIPVSGGSIPRQQLGLQDRTDDAHGTYIIPPTAATLPSAVMVFVFFCPRLPHNNDALLSSEWASGIRSIEAIST